MTEHHSPSTPQLVSAILSIALLSVSMIVYFTDVEKLKKKQQQLPTIRLFRMTTLQWRQFHILAQLIFQTVVYGGTLYELFVFAVYGANHYTTRTLVSVVPLLDHYIALPSLALCAVSGVVLVRNLYSSKRTTTVIPPHIHQTVVLLNLFGVYWIIADKVTQYANAPFVSEWFFGSTASTNNSTLFYVRLVINLGSCAMAYRLWWLMTKKGATTTKNSTTMKQA